MIFLITNVCEIPMVLKIFKFIFELLDILVFVIPMILIVFLAIDVAKNVIAGNTDGMKKNFVIAVKRIIMTIVIFLIPTIIDATLGLIAGINDDVLKGYKICKENYSDISLFEERLKQEREDYETQMKEEGKRDTGNKNKKKEPIIAYDGDDDKDDGGSSSSSKKAKAGEGLWVAHMKNSPDAVKESIKAGFWGIEVDVYAEKNKFHLYHPNTTKYDYYLEEFLDTCKKNNVVAVLDLKSTSNMDFNKLVKIVNDKDMLSNTIFQTSVGNAKKLHNIDSKARVWVLIGDGTKNLSSKKSDLSGAKGVVEGVNMLATNVDKDDIKLAHDLGLTICSFSYNKTMYKGRSASKLKEWGTNYLMANAIDE